MNGTANGPAERTVDWAIARPASAVAALHLHETMRQYAGLKLDEAGETAEYERRHAKHYAATRQAAAPEARYQLPEWLARLELDIDNVRAALARSPAPEALVLTTAVAWYWITRATGEGARRLDALLAADGLDPHVAAVGWFLRGFLGVLQSDPANARPALRRAADAAARTDQPTLRVQSLAMASIAANTAGDRAAARELLAAATASGTGARAGTAVGAEAAAAVGDYPAAISVLQARALDALFVGDAGAARAAGTVGAGLARAAGDLYSLGMMLSNVGLAELMAGELERCAAPCVEALRLARRLDDRVAQYCLLDALGCHAAGTGRPALAARLLGAAQAALDAAGARPLPYFEPLVDAATRAATGALGAERFRRGFAAGRALDRADAIALALGEPAGPPPAAPAGPAPLRERETQVAGLVAEGLSNRQIAARLLISEHTVDSHVRNILTKLGVGSRAQIAAWLATNRPAGP